MGLLNNIDDLLKQLEEEKKILIKNLSNEFKKHNNENVKYISKKPRIFTIKFSNLENNWSSEYYDFEYQFKALLYIFSHTELNNILNKWEMIKKRGIAKLHNSECKEFGVKNPYNDLTKDFIEAWYDSSYTILKFHPKVIKVVDDLLY